MTCAHVLDLIDAGPFADVPPAHLDAAWRHARQCATCGPALQAAEALTAELATLPVSVPPPDLAPIVLARIAQIESESRAPAAASRREAKAPSGARNWWAWVPAVGGLWAGLAILLSATLGDAAPMGIALTRFQGIGTGLPAMPSTTTGALILATGLLLYIGGLFAPLREKSRP